MIGYSFSRPVEAFRPRALFALLVTVGVLLGSGTTEPAAAADQLAEESDAPVVTFAGLRVYPDGSSTLFVNLTREVPVEFNQDGARLTFLLSGAKVRWRNNENPLIAKYFDTNVLRAKLDDTKEGVRLVVLLRENVATAHDMSSVGNRATLRIDVPPPSGG